MKLFRWVLLCLLLLAIPGLAEAQGNCSVYKTFGALEVLTAGDLNASLTQAAVTNSTLQCVDDYSASVAQMRTTTDPTGASLATSAAGEIERLRWMLGRLHGRTYWYTDPSPFTPPGDIEHGVASSRTGSAIFYHASSAFATTFRAGNATEAVTYTYPTAAPGANNYALLSSTAGVWSWGEVYRPGGTDVAVADGGTGLSSGTSGGILGYTASGTLASSGALTANALVTGGGAGATPSVLALGTANYILGMNSGATANEYKQIVQGSNMTITHAAESITFAASSGIAAGDSPTWTGTHTWSGAGPRIQLTHATDSQIFVGPHSDPGWAKHAIVFHNVGDSSAHTAIWNNATGFSQMLLGVNVYDDGTLRYIANAVASTVRYGGGSWTWTNYSSGVAGNALAGATIEMRLTTGLQIGSPTGAEKGTGTINLAADAYKNNTAYTNPGAVFEHFYTGQIVRFANEWGRQYPGLRSLEETEAFVRAHHELPLMATINPNAGIFDRGDSFLGSLEEAYLYIFALNQRIKALEAEYAK